MDAKTNPSKETARDKFLRLAPTRMETALKKISLIGNLAGPSYEHESDEAAQMIDALRAAVDDVANKFNKVKKGQKGFVFARKRGQP
jgi:ABC-type Fe3+-hydroxamate transport system substrate-binding protein